MSVKPNANASEPNPVPESFRYWGVLFLLVVLLPTLMCRYLAGLAVAERFATRLGTLAGTLQRQAAEQAKCVGPKMLEEIFLEGMVQPPAARRAFLSQWEKICPGATRLVIWNKSGEMFPGFPGHQLGDPQVLGRIVKRLLLQGMAIQGSFGTEYRRGAVQEAWGEFQNLLGSSVFAETVAKSFGVAWETRIQGEPGIVFWTAFPGEGPRDQVWAIRSLSEVQGFFVWLRTGALPPDFFARRLVNRRSRRNRDSRESGESRGEGLLVHRFSPERSFLPRDFEGGIEEVQNILTNWEQRTGPDFVSGSRLLTVVPKTVSPDQVLFWALDISHLQTEEQQVRARLNQVTGVPIALGLGVVILLMRGWGASVGLRRQVMLLLAIAMILPLSGVAWVGSAFVKEMELREKDQAFARMRRLCRELPRRLELFLPWFGEAMARRLRSSFAEIHSEEALLRFLNARKYRKGGSDRPGMFAHFYLGDAQGKIASSTFIGGKHELAAYRILVKRLHGRLTGTVVTGSLLGEGLIEDLETKGESGMSQYDLPWNTLSRIRLGRGVTYFLPLAVRLGPEKRVLLLHFSIGMLERDFLRFEMARGLLADDRKRNPEAPLHSFFRPLNAHNSAFASSAIPESIEGNVNEAFFPEAEGEFIWQGRSFLSYLAPRTCLNGLRPIFTLERSFLENRSGRRQWALASGLLGFFLLVLAVGAWTAQLILEPVSRLQQALTSIRSGDLEVSLPARGTDEIARLEASVNHLTRELREKDRLQAYLPETSRQAIREEGSASGFAARQQEITILFSDIRGFTTLSEKHPPEVIFGLLNDYFAAVEECIRAHQGQIQKFIGDAVYAVFPVAGAAGARLAVRAAVDMMKVLREFNQDRCQRNLFPIDIGIGVHTGTVLLGKVGSDQRQEFAFIGEAVTRAADLEAASKSGTATRIMLSAETRQLLGNELKTVPTADPAIVEVAP
jgi:class 3 adenylate cyclase